MKIIEDRRRDQTVNLIEQRIRAGERSGLPDVIVKNQSGYPNLMAKPRNLDIAVALVGEFRRPSLVAAAADVTIRLCRLPELVDTAFCLHIHTAVFQQLFAIGQLEPRTRLLADADFRPAGRYFSKVIDADLFAGRGHAHGLQGFRYPDRRQLRCAKCSAGCAHDPDRPPCAVVKSRQLPAARQQPCVILIAVPDVVVHGRAVRRFPAGPAHDTHAASVCHPELQFQKQLRLILLGHNADPVLVEAVISASKLCADAVFTIANQFRHIERMIIDCLMILRILRLQNRIRDRFAIDGIYAIAKSAGIEPRAGYRPIQQKFLAQQRHGATALWLSPRRVAIISDNFRRHALRRPVCVRPDADIFSVFKAQQQLSDCSGAALFVCCYPQTKRIFSDIQIFCQIGIADRRSPILLPVGVHSAVERTIAEKLPARESCPVKNGLLQRLFQYECTAEIHTLPGFCTASDPIKTHKRIKFAAAADPRCAPILRVQQARLKCRIFAPCRWNIILIPDHDAPAIARHRAQSFSAIGNLDLLIGQHFSAVPDRPAAAFRHNDPVSALIAIFLPCADLPLKQRRQRVDPKRIDTRIGL